MAASFKIKPLYKKLLKKACKDMLNLQEPGVQLSKFIGRG
jgi:hypothetical protein